MGLISWDNSKGFWANIGGGIADNTVNKIPGWDTSKGVLDNIGGGIADNTVNKIPGWDTSKGVADNVFGGLNDGVNTVVKTVEGMGSAAIGTLKRYWYVPVIIGGVVIGYKLIGSQKTNNLLAALAAKN